jgi:multidrug resistance efflux pump
MPAQGIRGKLVKMTRIFALPVTLLALTMAVWAADQSADNKSEEPESFDVEPPILKQNLSDEPLPDGDMARLEKQLERAKQNAAGAERLYKIGVLAKMEVEQRLLKVIRCESDLANARVARAKEELTEKESQLASGEITRDELESVKTALTQLTEAAQVATAKRERAELEAAEANLRRQQKLLKLGVGQKSDVTRAEQKLAELKAQKN